MLELREGRRCYPEAVEGVNVGLAFVDGFIAFLAFYKVILVSLSDVLHIGRWALSKFVFFFMKTLGLLVFRDHLYYFGRGFIDWKSQVSKFLACLLRGWFIFHFFGFWFAPVLVKGEMLFEYSGILDFLIMSLGLNLVIMNVKLGKNFEQS